MIDLHTEVGWLPVIGGQKQLLSVVMVAVLTVLMVFLGTRMDHRLLTLVMIVITAVLALLSYLRVLSLCRRGS